VDLQKGHLRGIEFPRLRQVYPQTMHIRSVLHISPARSSQKDLPQKGHLIILSGSSCFKALSPL
jgi:hypothetical protein